MPYRFSDEYLFNKKLYESPYATEEQKNAAAAANQAERDRLGVPADVYDYQSLLRARAYGGTKYTDLADNSIAALGNYSRYRDPYNTADLRQKLERFVYNPENDPVFQSYKDRYTREGQAAQGQTLANLTSLSGGRNNSWASAATAQVGQAYSQKIADMVPVLAQQAYDKLLQRYNIEAQESDRAYGRWIDAYGRTRDIADLSNRLAQQEIQNRRQQLVDDVYHRDSDLQYDISRYGFELDRKYGELEREQKARLMDLEILKAQYQIDYLPGQLELEYLTGQKTLERIEEELRQLKSRGALINFSRGSTSGNSPARSAAQSAKPMTKTAAKEFVSQEYGDISGEIDKEQLLNDIFYTDKYADSDIYTLLSAAGINKAQVNAWLQYKEYKYEPLTNGYITIPGFNAPAKPENPFQLGW
jgi:hypothetical protein